MAMMTALVRYEDVLLGGAVATALLTTILSASQGLGISRLSLPFIVGAFFTPDRARANVYGAIFYFIGGWLFALLYFWLFARLGNAGWFIGLLAGSLHGLFLLTVVLPLLPYIHPRMATDYDGPDVVARLEPPGFLGLNYGRRTPASTLIGHAIYGAVLGFFFGATP
ncbi:MAG: hypothetical protein M0R77_07210 [Gammaproteobacteria bacterium]|nr:hypothetical protein [Gammaproteobacteria bacterium]